MRAYIFCPKCREDSLDVDTLRCDCGYSPSQRIADLEKALRDAVVYADSQLLIPQTRAAKWKELLMK